MVAKVAGTLGASVHNQIIVGKGVPEGGSSIKCFFPSARLETESLCYPGLAQAVQVKLQLVGVLDIEHPLPPFGGASSDVVLSAFLLAPGLRDKVCALLTSAAKEILVLADAAAPGTELMLGEFMESLFVEVLRRYAAQLPAGTNGWFAALNDPILGRALQFVHGDPARRWTVDDLAREAVAYSAGRTIQCGHGTGADRVRDRLADAARRRAFTQRQ